MYISEVMEFARRLADRMKSELPDDHVGCKDFQTYEILAKMVYECGAGDYLEIGTWRGASAIIAARVKQEYGLAGKVYCIDHFKGYERNGSPNIGEADAVANFKRYGVTRRIEIVNSPSRPFPLPDRQFECAFIDGDHWGENPYLDFVEIKDRVKRFILMDDHDNEHEDVMKTVVRILQTYPEWKVKEIGNKCLLLGKN